MSDDPDDFRPGSCWRLAINPDGDVSMAVIYESVGVGDKIPRHWHDVDEVIIIEHGDATVHLGGADWTSRKATAEAPAPRQTSHSTAGLRPATGRTSAASVSTGLPYSSSPRRATSASEPVRRCPDHAIVSPGV